MIQQLSFLSSLALGLFSFALSTTFAGIHSPYEVCRNELMRVGLKSIYGFAVAGKSSGSELARRAQALGFSTVHIYPEGLDPDVIATFPAGFELNKQFGELEELRSVALEIRNLERQTGRRIVGFSPGMDTGAYPSDWASTELQLPGNSIDGGAWRLDKEAINAVFAGEGLGIETQRYSPEELLRRADELNYPRMIKPPTSSGSIGSVIVHSPDELRSGLGKAIDQTARRGYSAETFLVQQLLYPNRLLFVNTVTYRLRSGERRHIITGVFDDVRGKDFPAVVWDAMYLLPPSKELATDLQEAYAEALRVNERALVLSKTTVGTTHIEMMFEQTAGGSTLPGLKLSELINSSQGQRPSLKPIDFNPRHPGLDLPSLEKHATGVDPYHLDIASRAAPSVLDEFPDTYENWREHVALVFLRSHEDGYFSEPGRAWVEAELSRTPTARGARVLKAVVPQAGTFQSRTFDGRSMVGYFHIAGPSRESLEDWVENELRQRERSGFFISKIKPAE